MLSPRRSQDFFLTQGGDWPCKKRYLPIPYPPHLRVQFQGIRHGRFGSKFERLFGDDPRIP